MTRWAVSHAAEHGRLVEPQPAAESAGDTVSTAALVAWLVDQALPLWAGVGTDRTLGGYVERIDLDGRPLEEPRRTRVVARQIYVFAVAARRGWLPGADALVDHGLDFLRRRLRLPSGLYATAVHASGDPHRADFQLYEHAFVLFALATVAAARVDDRTALQAEAAGLLQQMRAHYGHPLGGFEEATPRTLPLQSNPHMHLLEAALAWAEVTQGNDSHALWAGLADELVGLCLSRFIDPISGALGEYFDGDWQPLPGPPGRTVVEPGHQFEWAWLLLRWSTLRGRAVVAVDLAADASPAAAANPEAAQARAAADRLLQIGEGHGVDRQRGAAVDALDDRLQVTTATAKLWPQTERCKAWHAAALLQSPVVVNGTTATTVATATTASACRTAAIAGLARYLHGPVAGLWHEVMTADGDFAPQPCRASSLYHIVCAVDTLCTPTVG